MTKNEFVRDVQKKLEDEYGVGCTLKLINTMIDAFSDTLGDALTNGERVCFQNFMTFDRTLIKGRTFNSGIDGNKYEVKDHYKVNVSLSKMLKNKLNGKTDG